MNIATMAMNKMTEMLQATDQKLKEFATEPYGVKELTEKEQMDMYKSLTPEKLIEMIQEKGLKDTNEWLYAMEQKEQKYGR